MMPGLPGLSFPEDGRAREAFWRVIFILSGLTRGIVDAEVNGVGLVGQGAAERRKGGVVMAISVKETL